MSHVTTTEYLESITTAQVPLIFINYNVLQLGLVQKIHVINLFCLHTQTD